MAEQRQKCASGALVLWMLALTTGCGRPADMQPAVRSADAQPPLPLLVQTVAHAQEMGQADRPRPLIFRLPLPTESAAPQIEPLPPLPADETAAETLPLELRVDREPPAPRTAKPAPATKPAGPQPKPRRVFAVEEFDAEAELAASTSMDDVLAFFPAESELSQHLKPRVQEAFTLARNGALHAARARFEQLLNELAQAKDASRMTGRHTRALAAGLRALEEADDFVVVGGDSEVTAQSLAAGHQTPMLHEGDGKWTLPHEAIAMYHLYAQQKLAAAVEGEQAGSMMLFGLGKIYTQLSERDDQPQAIRKSLTMYRSAVAAHQQNHLAANEAGVLLARSGRYAQAAKLLEQSARLGGASTTHRNLAYVHTKLGDVRMAQQHRALADRVARAEISRGQMSSERGIAWVSPDEFNRRTWRGSKAAVASRPAAVAPRSQQLPAPQLPNQAPKQDRQPQRQTMWW